MLWDFCVDSIFGRLFGEPTILLLLERERALTERGESQSQKRYQSKFKAKADFGILFIFRYVSICRLLFCFMVSYPI